MTDAALRRRLQLFGPLLRGSAGDARDDADHLPERGPGRGNPARGRPVLAGTVLVAATERGVCAILLGDDPADLVVDLGKRFPQATLIDPDPVFADCVAAVVRLVDDPVRVKPRAAARHSRDGVSAASLGGSSGDSTGRHGDLF